jgi:flagellar biosynthesis chaperone FliJ
MNAQRRKQIQSLIDTIDDAKSQLETLRDDEQEYYDNMPEGLQAGEKGDKAQECATALDDAVNDMESAISNLATAGE